MNGRYYLFIGANGPCSVSVNVGGKIFRAHHDEVSKGLISLASLDPNLANSPDRKRGNVFGQ